MPLGAQYAPTFADLIRREGEARAQGAANRGAIWGGAMSNLGPQIVNTFAQLRGQQQDEDARRAQADLEARKLAGVEADRAADNRRADLTTQSTLDTQQLTMALKRTEATSQMLGSARDQPSYEAALAQLSGLGVDTSKFPKVFSPGFTQTVARQALTFAQQLEVEAREEEKRQAANQQGVRRMIGESITARGGQPMDAGTRQTLQGMAFQEGVDLPESLTREPPRHVVTTPGPGGQPVARAVTEDELAGGVPVYRAPTTGAAPQYEWVIRGDQPVQIQKGTAQSGDVPYDAVAARQDTADAGPSPYVRERAIRTLQSVTELLPKVGMTTAGFGTDLAAMVGGTSARDFRAELETLKSNIITAELTAMREASKTGGALGQVSDREASFLSASLGALDPGQSPENLRTQLQKVGESLKRWYRAQGIDLEAPSPGGGGGAGGGPGPARANGPGPERVNPFRRP